MKSFPPDFLRPRRGLLLPLALLALAAATRAAPAADLSLRAILIRGANENLAASNNYVPADPALGAKLRSCRALQWTNYYEITNLTAVIPLNQSRDVRMSDCCTLRIRNLGSSQVAIDCIARDKKISEETNTLPLILGGNALILGGGDTNNTAWFVSLQAVGPAPGNAAGQPAKR
jgi:hypothetical protein